VVIITPKRWAILHENNTGEAEPDLAVILAKLEPCDLVLVEGYKQGSHAKLEVVRREGLKGKNGEMFLMESDPHIVAMATDAPFPNNPISPVFDLDDIEAIADFIEITVSAR